VETTFEIEVHSSNLLFIDKYIYKYIICGETIIIRSFEMI